MSPKRVLQIVLAVSCVGLLFSGVLSYQELFSAGGFSCPTPGASGTVLGYPACIYGFFMYFVLMVVSGFGLYGALHS